MSVVDIYKFIKEYFPFYKNTQNSLWKNAVRHSLSQYKVEFITVLGFQYVSCLFVCNLRDWMSRRGLIEEPRSIANTESML